MRRKNPLAQAKNSLNCSAKLKLDLQMPRVSGLEVLKWIREQSEFTLLPVVILSSSDQAPDARQAYELGANSYLIKSGNFEELAQRARRLGASWLLVKEPAS